MAQPPESSGGSLQPASVTFLALHAAQVTHAISTLFVRRQAADVLGDFCFTDPDEAFHAAQKQLAMHHTWRHDDLVDLAAEPPYQSKIENRKSKINLTLAIEGAACIRTLDDAAAFHAAGIRIISLAWAEGSRWAGGDQSGGDITPDGRRLIDRLDHLQIIHDVSHLSDRAFWTLLDIAKGPVVASHSNCRSLLPGAKFPERHLSDDQIRALAARPNALIGVNLFARFILPPDQLSQRRASIADLLSHIAHIEQLAGRRDLLALGSDFDSGFGTDLLPVDLQGPQDLPHLADALSMAGWSDSQITHFAQAWKTIL